ncbi:MAG: 50S ribosomal protein L6 [Elusimicrobia bacterium]|nr:50S ribosomal protein L6 [Elusimicrobiota bacterium]
MSRLGKKPIVVPSGVTLKIDAAKRLAEVKGPKGQLSWLYPAGFDIKEINGPSGPSVHVTPLGLPTAPVASPQARALWGLVWAKLQTMIRGVASGYSISMEIHGVGFKARQEGTNLILTLGASHPINYPLPPGISVAIDPKQTSLTISGFNKELVGRVASSLQALYPPEPYKGKGIRYSGEHILRKAGKAAASAGAGAKK